MIRPRTFRYKAVSADGKSRQGVVTATTEAEAYARLRSDNLSPVAIRPAHGGGEAVRRQWFGRTRSGRMTNVRLEETFSSLAVLLRSGADIRTALSVLDSDNAALRTVAQSILGGASVESAFALVIPPPHAHLRGLIAAGEARGELVAGLEAAANVLSTDRKIRQQLFEALSYPAFVLVAAVAALCVILMVVVPAIAPLLQESGRELPLYFGIIVFLSDGLQQGCSWIVSAALLCALVSWFGWRYGALRAWWQSWLLTGPLGGIAAALVFGGFAKTLGEALGSGATLTDALRLCQRGVGNVEARKRLDILGTYVRQGRRLSEALRQVERFPEPIIRLCEVGEASSSVGPMLVKAGAREELQGLARIDKASKVLGPALIVALGALIGGLMAGVLTALTDIGGAAGI